MFKKLSFLVLVLALTGFTAISYASHSVNGYFRGNGTYVEPHMSMDPGEARSSGFSYHDNQLVENGY